MTSRLGIAILLAGTACTNGRYNLLDRRPDNGDAAASACETAGEPARRADEFVDFLGVGIHVDELTDVHPNGRTALDELATLGIRHIKSDVRPATVRTGPLAAALQAKRIVPTFWVTPGTDVRTLLAAWGDVTWALAAPSYGDSMLPVEEVAGNTRAIAEALRASPEPRPWLIGPNIITVAGATTVGDLSAVIDYGAFRWNYGSAEPSSGIDGPLLQARRVAGNRPFVAVKAWHDGSRPGIAGTSELVQAKYVLRLLLEAWNRGFQRVFYERMYEPSDGHALFRDDGSEKPMTAALRGLLTAIAAPPTANVPRSLSFQIEGPTTDVALVHHTLIARADGVVVLSLWLSIDSEELDATRQITLRFAAPPKSVSLVDPRKPGEVEELSIPGSEISVRVSDSPVLLLLRPGC